MAVVAQQEYRGVVVGRLARMLGQVRTQGPQGSVRVGALQYGRALMERTGMAVLIPGFGDAGGLQQEPLAGVEVHPAGLGWHPPHHPHSRGKGAGAARG